jgi:hypothetical protein
MRRTVLTFILFFYFGTVATALVGDAPEVRGTGAGRHIVMIISTRGNFCTATALSRDLILTAAHCVVPPATYRVLIDQPPGIAIRSIAVHPRYNPKDYSNGRVTADVALIKLNAALPETIAPAVLGESRAVAPGDRFVVAGYGIVKQGSSAGGGTPRAATLVAIGKPGNLQIRLVDPTTRGERLGLGACTGDSGAPAFIERDGTHAVVGVVSWSTGPAGGDGCGGMTGITPLTLYRNWIIEQSKRDKSPISP